MHNVDVVGARSRGDARFNRKEANFPTWHKRTPCFRRRVAWPLTFRYPTAVIYLSVSMFFCCTVLITACYCGVRQVFGVATLEQPDAIQQLTAANVRLLPILFFAIDLRYPSMYVAVAIDLSDSSYPGCFAPHCLERLGANLECLCWPHFGRPAHRGQNVGVWRSGYVATIPVLAEVRVITRCTSPC